MVYEKIRIIRTAPPPLRGGFPSGVRAAAGLLFVILSGSAPAVPAPSPRIDGDTAVRTWGDLLAKPVRVIPSGQKQMMSYPVGAPGKLGKGNVFCELAQAKEGGNGGGDGLTIDGKGNLYITSGLGLQVFDPTGKALGVIAFPEVPANVTFGGKDFKTLYVTARTSVYTCPMEVAGHRFAIK